PSWRRRRLPRLAQRRDPPAPSAPAPPHTGCPSALPALRAPTLCTAGAPGVWSGTGCDDSALFVDAGGFSLNLNLSSCGAGCPAPLATLATLAQSRGGSGTSFLLDTVVETPLAANNFDYGPQGNHQMIDIPRPRVLSS